MTTTLVEAGTLSELARRFKANEVGKNPKGFHYIGIDATINRFNEVLGADWNLNIHDCKLDLLPTSEVTYGRAEKPGYLATVSASIYALGSNRGGTGSDFADDPDKALKTAQAEAMKKAGHQFGVGLYLWDERERALTDLVRSFATSGDAATLLSSQKRAVQMLAEIEGVEAISADTLAEHFGTTTGSLQDSTVLNGILANAGLV